jgi:excisionase family DNA binding protein
MTRRITGPEVLTRGEVAQVLGVHPSTVARWAAAGVLPCFRSPAGERRYRRSEIQDFLNQPFSAARASDHPTREQPVQDEPTCHGRMSLNAASEAHRRHRRRQPATAVG